MTSLSSSVCLDNLYTLIDEATPVGAFPAISKGKSPPMVGRVISNLDGKAVDNRTDRLVSGLMISPEAYHQLAPNEARLWTQVLGGQTLEQMNSSDGVSQGVHYKESPIVIAKDIHPFKPQGVSGVFHKLSHIIGGLSAGGLVFTALSGVGLLPAVGAVSTAIISQAVPAGLASTLAMSFLGAATDNTRSQVDRAGRAQGAWKGGSAFKAELKERLATAAKAWPETTVKPA